MKLHQVLLALAALVSACANGAGQSPAPYPGLEQAEIEVATKTGSHRFKVWIAADDRSREQGLMNVREMPRDRGMLFLFERPRIVAFWMKDTWLSLDLVFIAEDGTVLNVARHARPLSLDPIESEGAVTAVLEVLAGTAEDIGLDRGDRIVLPTLRTTSGFSKMAPARQGNRIPD